jgi:hypothetical protein
VTGKNGDRKNRDSNRPWEEGKRGRNCGGEAEQKTGRGKRVRNCGGEAEQKTGRGKRVRNCGGEAEQKIVMGEVWKRTTRTKKGIDISMNQRNRNRVGNNGPEVGGGGGME